MTIYIILFALVVIFAIACVSWWHKNVGEGTLLYAMYTCIILVALALVFVSHAA